MYFEPLQRASAVVSVVTVLYVLVEKYTRPNCPVCSASVHHWHFGPHIGKDVATLAGDARVYVWLQFQRLKQPPPAPP